MYQKAAHFVRTQCWNFEKYKKKKKKRASMLKMLGNTEIYWLPFLFVVVLLLLLSFFLFCKSCVSRFIFSVAVCVCLHSRVYVEILRIGEFAPKRFCDFELNKKTQLHEKHTLRIAIILLWLCIQRSLPALLLIIQLKIVISFSLYVFRRFSRVALLFIATSN